MNNLMNIMRQSVKLTYCKHLKFINEKKLLNGNLKSNDDLDPCIYFTLHKCASTFLAARLSKLFRRNGYRVVNLTSYWAMYDVDFIDRMIKSYEVRSRIFGVRGVFYNAFRYYVDIPNPEKYKILLIVRDPRDILVSLYYSMKYSHPIINENSIKCRVEASGLSIDEYVMMKANELLIKYHDYNDLSNCSNTLLCKYEDIVRNPADFEIKLSRHFNIDIAKNTLVADEDFKQQIENPYSHKRQITPGNHVVKLNKATIDNLNDRLRSIIEMYDYE